MRPPALTQCTAELASAARHASRARRALSLTSVAARRLSLDDGPPLRPKQRSVPLAPRTDSTSIASPPSEPSNSATSTHERQNPRSSIDDLSLPYSNYNATPGPSTSTDATPIPITEEAQTPVVIPDDPKGLIQPDTAAAQLLSHSAIVVVRQLEMLNVFLGFEQASKFALHGPDGRLLGYLVEEAGGIGRTLGRQFLRTHRELKCIVMDPQGKIVMRIHRPYSLINSRITVTVGSEDPATSTETIPVVGEARQVWAPLKRKYDLFVRAREGDDPDAFQQFGAIDGQFLAWDFGVQDGEGRICASINRRWGGWGREIFTDSGQYVLRFDAVVDDIANKLLPPETRSNDAAKPEDQKRQPTEEEQSKALVLAQERTAQGLTLDQRAVLLACACSIDTDFFSRARGGPGTDMMMWPMIFGGGGGYGETQPPAPDGSSETDGGRITSDDHDSLPPQQQSPAYDPDAPGANWSDAPMGEGETMNDPWAQPPPDPWSQTPQQGGGSEGGGWGDWGGGGGDSSDWF